MMRNTLFHRGTTSVLRRFSDEVPKKRAIDCHTTLSHTLWSQVIKGGDIVIDATCGNGYDSLALGNLALTNESGILYCLDIQSKAIDVTKEKLMVAHSSSFQAGRIKIFQCSHVDFPAEILPGSVSAVVYNLGFLPGTHEDGPNRITTTVDNTMKSIENSLPLLKIGGMLSIMLYRGHPEGLVEANACLEFCKYLKTSTWRVCSHEPINSAKSPVLVTIARR